MKNLFGSRRKKTPGTARATASPIGRHPASRAADASARQPVLDNPDFSVQEEGIDPYNSGVFDRSESWARVNKRS